MPRISTLFATSALLGLGACAVVPPAGPTVTAMPGKGKSFEAFQQDDGYCRQYASAQTGGVQPAQAATQSAVGSAAVGTAVGAAAGALIGSASGSAGAGAAIGAGAGLLGGSLVGSSNAQYSGAELQHRYDVAYAQCMFGHGDTVTQPGTYAPGYATAYPVYPVYPGPYAYPPAYYPPAYYSPGYVGAPVVVGPPAVAVGVGHGWW